MPLKWICLASYNCRCRPVGVGVSRRTMKFHKKAANEKRNQFGLPLLPPGPQFSDSASQEQALIHANLFSITDLKERQPVRVQDLSGKTVALSLGDFSPPLSHISQAPRSKEHAKHNQINVPFHQQPPVSNSLTYFPPFQEFDDSDSEHANYPYLITEVNRNMNAFQTMKLQSSTRTLDYWVMDKH